MILYARDASETFLFFLTDVPGKSWTGHRLLMKVVGKKNEMRVHSYAPLTKLAPTEIKNKWYGDGLKIPYTPELPPGDKGLDSTT